MVLWGVSGMLHALRQPGRAGYGTTTAGVARVIEASGRSLALGPTG